jgi:hypothetical protein
MSYQTNERHKCLTCGHLIHPGGYIDEVLVKLPKSRFVTRYVHGGPCGMALLDRLGNRVFDGVVQGEEVGLNRFGLSTSR